MSAPVRIALLDYRMSNLRSAGKALERLGARVRVVSDGADLGRDHDGLVLPGVGNFGEASRRIADAGFAEPVRAAVEEGVPLLGICLGMQLLFEESEEEPGATGLGVLPGRVARLRTSRKVPHIGWSVVSWRPGTPLAPATDGPHERTYYFVHSYACVPADDDLVLGTADHGVEFVAAAGRGNVAGVQFHPEKSSDAGLGLLGRWIDAVRQTRPLAEVPAAS